MSTITRNGKAYDSADVKVFISGIPIDVTSITYGNEEENQLNYTLDQKPTSWSRGKITPSCTMGIMMADITPLEKAAKGGSILNIKPFDVVVVFANEYNFIVTDKLLVKFQSEGRDVTGDMGLKKEYTMFAITVDLGVI